MNQGPLRQSYDRMLAIRASGPGDRSDCLAPEALQRLLERSDPEEQRLRQLDHVMACPYCLPEFELLRSVAKAEGPNPMRRILALAALIVIFIGLVTVWRFLTTTPGSHGQASVLRLWQPVDQEAVDPPVYFAWNSVPGAVEYQIQVLTPAGQLMWQAKGPDTAAALPPSQEFVAGEYRWSIVARLANGEQERSPLGSFKLVSP